MTSYGGAASPADSSSEYNTLDFIIRQTMGKLATCTLVQIVTVTPADGTCDVRPMIAQIDALGVATPHGIIHNVPYVRLQGGANAVIIDPAVGDIGIAIFASRDTSTVKATKAPGLPGSRRSYDWADALYVGGVLNGVPTQFVRFTDDGIEITSPTMVTVTAPEIAMDGHVTFSEMPTMPDATIDGKVFSEHHHGGVTTGGGTTGAPT